MDVNNNPANPVINTRSFSDDPTVVSSLGTAFIEGLHKEQIITAHIQYPKIENATYVSKSTGEEIYLPATLSKAEGVQIKFCTLFCYICCIKFKAVNSKNSKLSFPLGTIKAIKVFAANAPLS